jgi:hypothetical protein
MPRESKALSDMQVRKLSFKLDIDGNPKPDRHPVGGVAGLQALNLGFSGSRSETGGRILALAHTLALA